MTKARAFIDRILRVVLVVLLLGVVALAGLARLVPAAGHPVLIIRGGSMSPAIPIGAAGILDPGSIGVRPGDVVTIRLDNGSIFTHRVTHLASLNGVSYVETKGDANATVDPALTPLDQVVGRVVVVVPTVGYLMAWLATPAGAITMLGAVLTLIAALWFLEMDGIPSVKPAPARRGPHSAGMPQRS